MQCFPGGERSRGQCTWYRDDIAIAVTEIITVTVISLNQPVNIKIPIKVDLKVIDAPPAVKGDTATGGSKLVTLESGATILTPLFINPDDVLRINTDIGEYVERVNKA